MFNIESLYCILLNKIKSPTFLVTGDIQAKIFDKGLKNVSRWTWYDESLSYTDAKGNTQTANVSDVFKKCTKAGHVWFDICQCEFSYSSNSNNFSINAMNRSPRLLV